MKKPISVIADTTFYSCFLNDINDVYSLIKIIKSGKFLFTFGPVILSELRRNPNFIKIKDYLEKFQELVTYDIKELVKPFLGEYAVKKGEDEVIGIAIVYTLLGRDYILILDEDNARKFVKRLSSSISSFKPLEDNMTGTAGFIKKCACEFKIFEKKEAITLLYKIKESKFRIDENLIDLIIHELMKVRLNDNEHQY